MAVDLITDLKSKLILINCTIIKKSSFTNTDVHFYIQKWENEKKLIYVNNYITININ